MSTDKPTGLPTNAAPANEDLTQGKIIFVENFAPALPDGDYEIVVGQRVQNTGSIGDKFDEAFVNRHRFRVEGPRYRLGPDALRAVFPPPDSLGEFQGVLPHVVLERKTLPWERSADPDGDRVPWLAILLFDATDPAVPSAGGMPWQAQTAKVASLLPAKLPAGTVSYPGLQPDAAEQDQPCQFIDVPASTWQTVAPAYEELRWLAHARHVDGQKSGETVPAGGDLAVVVCNRLPNPNRRSTAHLVSLEGMKACLRGADGKVVLPAETTVLRLLSLKSWNFTSKDPEQTFGGLLKGLSVGPLRVPYTATPPEGSSDAGVADAGGAESAVRSAFALGYTALEHDTRNGDRVVSWYRGPLLPLTGGSTVVDPTVEGPVGSADQLLRRDPATGMLDTSYAAAWQIGQLLALQDKSFAEALVDWKHANLQAAAVAVEKLVLHERLDGFPDLSRDALMRNHVATLDHASAAALAGIDPAMPLSPPSPPAPASAGKKQAASAYHESAAHADRFIRLLRDPHAWRETGATEPVPLVVTRWLARLRLLAGVPFNYLVPEEAMLPRESLRFFEVDWHWLYALVEGAFSIGRSSPAVGHHDAAVHDLVHGPAQVGIAKNPASTADPDPPPDPISGLLLRSAAVSGWPALQVSAYAKDSQVPLPTLRTIHLSASVLMVMVQGHIDRVVIAEPPEGLHFGVEIVAGQCIKPLRRVTGDPPGQQLGADAHVEVVFREPRSARVLNISSLQGSVHDMLNLHQANIDPDGQPRPFSSAEFALQMVEGVQAVAFTNRG